MLDTVGSAFVGMYAASILLLAFHRAAQAGAVRSLTGTLLLWALAQSGLFFAARSGAMGDLPPNVLMFGLTLLSLGIVLLLAPRFRQAAAETGLTQLIGLHVWRLGGFLFLLLAAQDRLGSPFAPVAAIGDIITGTFAAVIVVSTIHGRRVRTGAIRLWNAFGLVDLAAAVALAFLSIPGAPFQLFFDVPADNAFAALPWLLVPAAIVPALFFVHLAIFAKLARARLLTDSDHPDGAKA